MTAKAKSSKRTARPTKGNGKPEHADDTVPTNGTIAEQPKANTGATALATTDKANGQRRTPVPYSDEIGDSICDRLRDGETLNSICKTEGMPSEAAVRLWASEDTPFAAQYARARETRLSENGR
jgi:hypothetical protein